MNLFGLSFILLASFYLCHVKILGETVRNFNPYKITANDRKFSAGVTLPYSKFDINYIRKKNRSSLTVLIVQSFRLFT